MPKTTTRSHAGAPIRACIGAAMVMLLVACGEDASEAGVGNSGTGFSVGRVDGLGTRDGATGLRIDGVTFDEGTARVLYEIDPRAPAELPVTRLKLGMRAGATHQGARTDNVVVMPELLGPVEQVQADQRLLVVAGQRVQIDAVAADVTAFEGFARLGELQPGTMLAVHGQRDADGLLRASRLEVQPPLSGYRLSGSIERLDPAARRLVLNGTSIDYRAAARMPADLALAEGLRISVYAATYRPAADAQTVEVIAAAPVIGDGAPLRLGGVITAVAAGTITVDGLRFDLSTAQIVGAAAEALRPGRMVQIDATGTATGAALRARRVVVVADDRPVDAVLASPITGFVGATRFQLRSNAVDASAARFDGMTVDNLGNGVPIRAQGSPGGPAMMANSIAATAAQVGGVVAQVGVVDALQPATGGFRLVGLPYDFRLQPTVRYVGLNAAEFVNGLRAQTLGSLVGGEFAVTEVRRASEPAMLEMSGIVWGQEGDWRASGWNRFWFGDHAATYLPSARISGPTNSAADIQPGRWVVVRGRPMTGGPFIHALEVEVRTTRLPITRIGGNVGDIGNGGDSFRIDGQRVDARAAVFIPAQFRTELWQGAYVGAEGAMVNGVFVAQTVRDLNYRPR